MRSAAGSAATWSVRSKRVAGICFIQVCSSAPLLPLPSSWGDGVSSVRPQGVSPPALVASPLWELGPTEKDAPPPGGGWGGGGRPGGHKQSFQRQDGCRRPSRGDCRRPQRWGALPMRRGGRCDVGLGQAPSRGRLLIPDAGARPQEGEVRGQG